MNKTITFDPSKYKLVPVEPSNESCDVMKQHADGHLSNIGAYCDMIAAVPDQLPGVVEHSGEPVAWKCGDSPFTDYAQAVRFAQANMWPITELFAHPAPSQPSTTKYTPPTETECDEFRRLPGSFNDMVRAIHEHGYHTYAGAANVHFGEFYKAKFDAAIAAQPSAEALVRAALEAAKKYHDDLATAAKMRNPVDWWLVAKHQGDAAAIRALSAQQIIESCKEKS